MQEAKKRCFGDEQDFYAQYHDTEWGVIQKDEHKLFEMLILEGAQAGLSFETILKKREGYRKLFYNFDPVKVAALTENQLEKLRLNPAIIRNRLKILSAKRNAQVFLDIQKEFGSFYNYLWGFIGGKQIVNRWASLSEMPTETEISKKLSKDLKKRGMNFVGPTIMYAYMQAIGMVNDHIIDCICSKTK